MEKLTHSITVKVTDDAARKIAGLAVLDGADGCSEWVRHVVLRELESRRKQSDALRAIFEAEAHRREEYRVGHGLPAAGQQGGAA